MNVGIIVYSNTGNTLSVAQKLEQALRAKRTCRQVGAKLFFERGIEADAFLQQYLTEYNKVYSRRYRAAGI